MSQIKEISDATFDQEISEGINLVDFNAGWCPPCRMMQPILNNLAVNSEFQKIGFKSVDVDHNPKLPKHCKSKEFQPLLLPAMGKLLIVLLVLSRKIN
ncbi:MAG: thioredoxin family protein [Liquorilactobacillus nagelii]|nr:thioredoxin family protein [Liquorilactobacillus nagelii]MCI1632843.1 thioredoxin family protein [Liquorilactobacillus nagelii]